MFNRKCQSTMTIILFLIIIAGTVSAIFDQD